MDSSEIKKLNDAELKGQIGVLQGKLFTMKSQAVTGKVEDTSQFHKLKRDIARLLTERSARHNAKRAAQSKKPAKA